MTAAAQKVNIADKKEIEKLKKRQASDKWQEDSWEYYDIIGEIKYAFRLFSNVMSRIRLYAAVVTDDDSTPDPIKDHPDLNPASADAALTAMRRVFAGPTQSELLRTASINLLVTGECYLVQEQPKAGLRDREKWRIVSTDQLVATQRGAMGLKPRRDSKVNDIEPLPGNAFVGRIWSQHARYSDEADSSMRALVDLCDELMLLSRTVRATARSRLNAGALFVPDTLSVSVDQSTEQTDPVGEDGTNIMPEDEDDEFEQELLDAMTTPIADESSAAAVVPLLIRGPADAGDKIKHIKFERAFDPQLTVRAERALERILQGIDLPKDIVTGLANIKYSNAVQIEESMYTAHIEPLVLMLCDAFREVYLVPALEKMGVPPEDIDKIVIWYDPAAIMTAPDKSNAANIGFDKMALSWEAWRRSNGFADTDAPTPKEVAQRLAIQRGQLSEQITEALFRTMFPEILDAARAQAIANSPSPLGQNVQDMLAGRQSPPEAPGAPAGGTPPAQPPVDDSDAKVLPPPVPGQGQV